MEYAARFHRVLAHIDQHLDQVLRLDRLAAVAHFSPFHFHRLFTAWMGETLGDYLRRGLHPRLQAALAFRGTAGEAPAAWASLLRDWLPASSLQVDARPFFEFYPQDSTYDPGTGIFTCQLCVPVAPI